MSEKLQSAVFEGERWIKADEAEAHIAELEARVPQWVDGYPPNRSGKYIVLFEDGSTGLSSYHHNWTPKEWNHSGIVAWCEVPLPTPPKEEDDAK